MVNQSPVGTSTGFILEIFRESKVSSHFRGGHCRTNSGLLATAYGIRTGIGRACTTFPRRRLHDWLMRRFVTDQFELPDYPD
jgi:hypothetical protein